jgi:uncharacterized protein involved in exopolysaccharide biosynthesis
MERVIEQMRSDVQIDLKGDNKKRDGSATIAFAVGYSGTDPQKVALVATALATAYIEENLKMRERQAAGTAGFLLNQVEELGRKLQTLEKAVSGFKERYIGELPEQMDANLKSLEQLTAQLRLNGDNMSRAAERKSTVEKELVEALGATTPTGPDAMALRLGQLRQQLAAFETRYSERHPDIVRLKGELQALEAQLSSATGSGRWYNSETSMITSAGTSQRRAASSAASTKSAHALAIRPLFS